MGRLLQRFGNASHTAAGAEDVATDLVTLPHGAVLVGLADLGEELETHLVLARTIEAMAQIGGGTFILLLVVGNAARCSRTGERQRGQRNAEWTICVNLCWTGCCACAACCRCCCCRLDWTSGLRCGLLLLAIVELLLFGVAHRRVCEFLGRMWMRWLCGCTHWHNTLTAKTPEIWIEEIEAIGQTRTWRCACERRISQQCCCCWCWPLPVLLQKSGTLQDKQCAVPVTQHSLKQRVHTDFMLFMLLALERKAIPASTTMTGPTTQPPPQLPYCPLPMKSVYVDVRPFTILFTDPLLP